MNRRELLRGAALVGVGAFGARRGWAADVGASATAEQVWSNARILTGRMPDDGASELTGGVHVVDGRIVAIGREVTGGIDLGGATLWPGMWETGSTMGLAEIDLEPSSRDDVETTDPFDPQMRAIDAFNPESMLQPVLRARGVMGALVIPGGGVVSGQAAWMRTSGRTVSDATVMAPAGLVVNLGKAGVGGTGPTSRMGVAARLRDVLDANPPPKEPPKASFWKRTPPAPPAPPKPPTRAEGVWHDLLSRKLKAVFVADRASDIEIAIGLAADYQLDAVILGAAEGWMLKSELHDAGIPLVLGPVTVQPDGFAHPQARYDNAALLHAAGVRFGIRIGDPHRTYDLSTEAGIAVAWGLPPAVAVAAITGNSPGLFGLTQGRLAVGDEASFVVSDGDPLEPRTSVNRVVVRGVEMPLVNHQTELHDRFKVLK